MSKDSSNTVGLATKSSEVSQFSDEENPIKLKGHTIKDFNAMDKENEENAFSNKDKLNADMSDTKERPIVA